MYFPISQKKHEIHKFVKDSATLIQTEYDRISARSASDPGTAGDEGEANWAQLLREWLPSYFHVETKGQILFENDETSGQIDVVILSPSYPKILQKNKRYIAGGVIAAFECKNTLIASHVKKTIETSAFIKRSLASRQGTPYQELNAEIFFGLLAHSHSWKEPNSTPIDNVTLALQKYDGQFVSHPRECLDLLCVADLAAWVTSNACMKFPFDQVEGIDERFPFDKEGNILTGYVTYPKAEGSDFEFNTPIGIFLTSLYSRLSRQFPDMKPINEYFQNINLGKTKNSQCGLRMWPLSIYSAEVRDILKSEDHPKDEEWSYF